MDAERDFASHNRSVDEFSAAGTSKQSIYEHASVYTAEVRFHLAILTGV